MTDTETLAERLATQSAIPADCTDEELGQADFSRRDVLVGTVRSDAQFEYTIASLSYYAPVKTIPPHDLPVRMIALYEEGLTRRPGIKRFGLVTETRVVCREDIPVPMSRSNGQEAYYLFSVCDWVYLEHPISLEGTSRGRPAFTTEFLLTHARRSYQLVGIRSPAEYRLTQALCALLEAYTVGKDLPSPVFRRISDSHLLSAADGTLSLIHARGEVLCRIPLSAMRTEPAEVLHRLGEILGI